MLALEAGIPADILDAAPQAILHTAFAGVETTLLAEPKEMCLGVPQLRIPTAAAGDGLTVRLESDALALSVMLWLDGADAAWSDSFFHILPGVAREVQVRPWSPMAAVEVAARLRWRAL